MDSTDLEYHPDVEHHSPDRLPLAEAETGRGGAARVGKGRNLLQNSVSISFSAAYIILHTSFHCKYGWLSVNQTLQLLEHTGRGPFCAPRGRS